MKIGTESLETTSKNLNCALRRTNCICPWNVAANTLVDNFVVYQMINTNFVVAKSGLRHDKNDLLEYIFSE